MQPSQAPYGSWSTPFTSSAITAHTIGFGTIVVDNANIYWIETRPAEGGRHVIVRHTPGGTTSDVTPTPYNARTRVHEYGGGAFTVSNSIVYFSNYDDQKLYRQKFDAESTGSVASTPECLNTPPGMRFAEALFDPARKRLIAVCEEHSIRSKSMSATEAQTEAQAEAQIEAINSIVAIALDGSGKVTELTHGCDFYAMPKLSPAGDKLAWLSWNHPNMPWDGTSLFVANLDADGNLGSPALVAGGANESIVQPEWSPSGDLFFISDRSGWWNLYRQNNHSVESVDERQAEFCRASWHLGYSSYAWVNDKQLICSYNENGFWRLGLIALETKELSPLECEFTDIWWLKTIGQKAVFRGASPSRPQAIILLDIEQERYSAIAESTNISLPREMISEPTAIEFPTSGGLSAFGFFYPPKNPNYFAPSEEKPPLLVKAHGGPTGTALTMLNLEIQFWTSRGFALLDVNYSGSVGYGRAYRERLAGTWGIADVADCLNGARHLVKIGAVDPSRLLISGGSAGGFTTLCALTFHDLFRAGTSYYGISDLAAMRTQTHKFESHYLDKLVGEYPARADIYRERSPLHHIDRLNRPIAFFQGEEDKIVPPNQTEMMVDALRMRKIPVACIIFEHEQHAFRRAQTISRSLDGELYFYAKILGIEIADDVVPLPIENLKNP